MESINKQLDFNIDGCRASLIVNSGFINSSGVSPGNLHTHPFYEIHFIVFGENSIRHPKGVITAQAGDIFIVPPGLPHCFIPINNIGEHKRAAFWIDISIIDARKTDKFVFDTLYSLKNITHIKNSFDAFYTVQEIQSELMGKKPCYEENLVHVFAKLMIQICRCIDNEGLDRKHANEAHQSLMLLIEEYIQENYKSDCSLKGLSENLNISQRQLTRLINSLYSRSFRQMLLEQRMSMANWLIETKNTSFEAIAAEVGYGSLTAFYHAYIGYFGCTPGEYRRRTNILGRPG